MRPLLLSMLSSILACRSLLVVREEKLIYSFMNWSGDSSERQFEMMTDLAVPDSPTNMQGNLFLTMRSKTYEYFLVSTVGTSILLNLMPSGVSQVFTSSFQLTHYLFMSKQKSKILIFLSGMGFSTRLRSLSQKTFLDSILKQAPRLQTVAKMKILYSLSGSGRFYMLSSASNILVS